jgi:hypothetical protein
MRTDAFAPWTPEFDTMLMFGLVTVCGGKTSPMSSSTSMVNNRRP